MFFPKSALLAATFAAMASAASVRRQTPATCSTMTTGYLGLKPASDGADNGAATNWVGTVSDATHSGIDGPNEHLLVTKNDDGSPLGPQKWEFARCTSDDNHVLPPGYTRPTSAPTNLYFGILRPASATQHCLALESENDATNGAQNSIVDSFCTKVPEAYRLWMIEDYLYGDSSTGMRLFFANENETATIGNTPHAEVQFVTNGSNGKTPMQLTLFPNP